MAADKDIHRMTLQELREYVAETHQEAALARVAQAVALTDEQRKRISADAVDHGQLLDLAFSAGVDAVLRALAPVGQAEPTLAERQVAAVEALIARTRKRGAPYQTLVLVSDLAAALASVGRTEPVPEGAGDPRRRAIEQTFPKDVLANLDRKRADESARAASDAALRGHA